MRRYLVAFLLGIAGIAWFFSGWRPGLGTTPVDRWSREGIEIQNKELLSWPGLIERAERGQLRKEPSIEGAFEAEDLAGILRAVKAAAGQHLKPVSLVNWSEKQPGQVLVVLSPGWVWSEEAAMACGSGTNFFLQKSEGEWVVTSQSSWMS